MNGPLAIPDPDLERMLLIRRFEQGLLAAFDKGVLSGTTHTCIGQEYVPVALSKLLQSGDHVLSNHRGHGHYLARFDDPAGLLAEIMGRQGAICGGVGGSQHIQRDGYLSTGVQGESLPVAVGIALHLKRAARGALALAYVGDGTWGEGTVYEALNMASLWKVPLVVAVEHNQIAQTTPTDLQMAGTIEGRARAFGVAYAYVDGFDVVQIREQLAPLVARVRDGAPLVIEFSTPRIGPHSKGDDTRPEHVLSAARARDWRAAYGKAFPEQLARLDAVAESRMQAVFSEVSARAPSTWERA